MEWAGASASVLVEAGAAGVFELYKDLEAMPRWSPWLVRVVVADDGAPEGRARSTWTLGARGLTFSWEARNTEVVSPQAGGGEGRIAWVSEGGLRNRGKVRFQEVRGGTKVELSVEVEVPERAAGVLRGGTVVKFVEDTLLGDLKRFRGVVLKEESRRRRAERKREACKDV